MKRTGARGRTLAWLGAVVAGLVALSGCAKEPAIGPSGEPVELRLGHFPNITHAQALIGVARGDFQRALGDDVKLVAHTFNAGPSVIEALYAGHIDMAYVGPSPILNGYIQSQEEEVRVVAGAAVNGVLVIGNKVRGIERLEQLVGKRIATPQYANTQDISAKFFLTNTLGATLKSQGGDTDVLPMANPDIEILFAKNQIDAAWVPEPWGTRIIEKGLATLVVEEKELWTEKSFPNTNIIARRAFLEKHPQLVSRFLQAHVRVTRDLQADPQAYGEQLNAELKRLTTKSLPREVVEGALRYTGFDYELSGEAFRKEFDMGKSIGLIRAESLDVDKLIVAEPLRLAVEAVDAGATTMTTAAQVMTISNSAEEKAQ